jgi:hypothetical protein
MRNKLFPLGEYIVKHYLLPSYMPPESGVKNISFSQKNNDNV